MSNLALDGARDEKGAVASETIEHATGDLENNYASGVDRELEKKLLRKFDIHILPALAVMYLFKYALSFIEIIDSQSLKPDVNDYSPQFHRQE
jgi:hypothetical protein